MELLRGPFLLVANPAARRARRRLAVAAQALGAEGARVDVATTERPGHAAEIVRARASGYEAVFTLGGDGTAMEVVGALAHSGIPVGILPGGTGNLVARALGFPIATRRAAATLPRGDVADVDLGRLASGRCFAFSFGVGVDARMIHDTPPVWKKRLGILAYAYVAFRASLRNTRFRVRATVDGEVLEREAAAVMVANFGAVLNDLIVLGPGIARDDGKLDLCVFSPASGWEAVSIAWRLLRKDFRPHRAITYRPGKRFRIECDPPQDAQADGELVGTTPLELTVDPGAARLLLPRVG
ncbi:MAG TPA: diacylglycerol kinase family protein [Candidatus Limnocylindria bacterium]|nr:diacylglycerol kinase family protein [Candidatus Limnocylindria bacterium]